MNDTYKMARLPSGAVLYDQGEIADQSSPTPSTSKMNDSAAAVTAPAATALQDTAA